MLYPDKHNDVQGAGGAANPTDIFLPILLATFVSTLVGIVALCLKQRIRLTDPVLLAWLAGDGGCDSCHRMVLCGDGW